MGQEAYWGILERISSQPLSDPDVRKQIRELAVDARVPAIIRITAYNMLPSEEATDISVEELFQLNEMATV